MHTRTHYLVVVLDCALHKAQEELEVLILRGRDAAIVRPGGDVDPVGPRPLTGESQDMIVLMRRITRWLICEHSVVTAALVLVRDCCHHGPVGILSRSRRRRFCAGIALIRPHGDVQAAVPDLHL